MTVHSAADGGSDRGGDKRARILGAAERVFARRGFFAARVSEIAKDAGVADGTIYLYFKSKDDLLISLFEIRMKQVNDVLRAAIASPPGGATATASPINQLRAFIKAYLKLVHDEPAAAEVLTIELRQSSKFMKEYENPQFADFLRMLGGLIAAGQERGELDATIPAHVAARMIFGMLDELALAWVLAKQPLPTAATSEAAISAKAPGTRPKKFDIVRAADWVVALVMTGLDRSKKEKSP
ncbi:MAG: TetR/AcrR family transcriptional regulator [Deltaproteobacteria bacterium]|nr:TetR/AcrR family transcriptional regulator [Deltaproteobacteria bacterium]MDQ3295918.1 TetR family transcriptional regulator [Myxococcota bacterium]